MTEEIAKITYASAGYLPQPNRKIDTAEIPKKEGEFEKRVRETSQKVAPIPDIPETEDARRYSKSEVSHQIEEVHRILEEQKSGKSS